VAAKLKLSSSIAIAEATVATEMAVTVKSKEQALRGADKLQEHVRGR
jgi:hypothetical protein